MVLGYPKGVSANAAGFPILRAGRVASYPLAPASRYPTYLVDFNVFAGNSGGPVYVVRPGRSGAPARSAGIVVTGLLTQQIELHGQRLEIGNVTQADFIGETLSLLAGGATTAVAASGEVHTASARAASSLPAPSPGDRLKLAWRALTEDLTVLVRRAWIVVRDIVLRRVTAAPERVS